jgi:glycosyltransferase involved in cell wall biosynthesis
MKIAQVVPLLAPLPPVKYGGIERIVAELSYELADRGHEVTLFGAGGSSISGQCISLIECSPFPTFKDTTQTRKWEIHQFFKIIQLQNEFDVIHFHYEPYISRFEIDGREVNAMDYINVPKLITFHNSTNIPLHEAYYRTNGSIQTYNYTFLSNAHAKPLDFLPKKSIVYNGINVEKFPFIETPGDYLLFVGRITPSKGIVQAIEVAVKSGKKLIIAALLDPNDKEFYDKEVAPRIDGKQIIYVGEVNFEEKVKLFSEALCTLCPLQWEEPFGLVMAESQACGTPVLAFNRGAASEVVKDKETGYIIDTVDQMVEAVNIVHSLNRNACRHHVENNFSTAAMTDTYLAEYEKIINTEIT